MVVVKGVRHAFYIIGDVAYTICLQRNQNFFNLDLTWIN